jgi:hypothetical protein
MAMDNIGSLDQAEQGERVSPKLKDPLPEGPYKIMKIIGGFSSGSYPEEQVRIEGSCSQALRQDGYRHTLDSPVHTQRRGNLQNPNRFLLPHHE